MQNDRSRSSGLFKDAFLGVLLARLPPWRAYVGAGDQPIEVVPPNWQGPPFRIDIGPDSITIFPLCQFGLDYISSADTKDLQEKPDIVFAKVVADITNFVDGRTVVAIKRRRWLFLKAGWDVRFVAAADLDEVRRGGASVIAWPGSNERQ
jgi:hypothetical protein